MPKLGMGPIRREQICRAAAAVIAREGLPGTTMRMVAEEAGVSTGMLNHYFANRQDLLTQALVFVSERAQARMRGAVEGVQPGRALVDANPGRRTRQFSRLDLPTLLRPKNAISSVPVRVSSGGNCCGCAALMMRPGAASVATTMYPKSGSC